MSNKENKNKPTEAKRSNTETWELLKGLREQYDKGLMSSEQFLKQKKTLIDSMTGTTGASKADGRFPTPRPPDFVQATTQRAVEHRFDPLSHSWASREVTVKIESEPFAKGSLRFAHHMMYIDPSLSESEQVLETRTSGANRFVGKIAVDVEDQKDRSLYFTDVEMQMYAKQWAARYNQLDPPKTVDFIDTWVIELVERPHHPLIACEQFIAGAFYKYNNNAGFISKTDRNTPQAFSHFTYEASRHEIVICDIQGVGDMYTDPQFHCASDPSAFGLGNGAKEGIYMFLRSHKCSRLCQYLKLPSINPKTADTGTVVNGQRFTPTITSITEVSPVEMRQRTYVSIDTAPKPCCVIL